MNRIALELARRYGNTPAWGVALRVVDRARDQLRDLWLFLYDHDGQRIAREAVREREIDEAAKQAVAEVGALIARLQKEGADAKGADDVEPIDTALAADVESADRQQEAARLRGVGEALGRDIIEKVRLRAATSKAGRN